MRPTPVISALSTILCAALPLAALSACQIDEVEFDDDELGELQQASIGAELVPPEAHHEALAAITILLPPEAPEVTVRTDERFCTGVLVGPNVVMTAASCLNRSYEAQLDDEFTGEYLDADSIKVQFGSSSSQGTEYHLLDTFTAGPTSLKGLVMHRHYIKNTSGTNDVALLVLSASPTEEIVDPLITTADLNTALFGEELETKTLELVGYGQDDADGFTIRQVVKPLISAVSDSRVTAGDPGVKTTCFADSGGPGFYDFGQGAVVISVSERHGKCEIGDNVPTRERVDRYAANFVNPLLRYADGCTDCDDCDFNGVCKEDCPTRDLDCDVGAFTGDACNQNGDCEENGSCVAAGDDATFTYCSNDCEEGVANNCPSTMACVSGKCIYDGISPGSQGADCAAPGDCRSGFCESLLCANECNAADANSCDTAAGFACLPTQASGSSATVCRLNTSSGGGGFCAIGPGRSGSNTGALGGFGLIFLLGLFLRRRR